MRRPHTHTHTHTHTSWLLACVPRMSYLKAVNPPRGIFMGLFILCQPYRSL